MFTVLLGGKNSHLLSRALSFPGTLGSNPGPCFWTLMVWEGLWRPVEVSLHTSGSWIKPGHPEQDHCIHQTDTQETTWISLLHSSATALSATGTTPARILSSTAFLHQRQSPRLHPMTFPFLHHATSATQPPSGLTLAIPTQSRLLDLPPLPRKGCSQFRS